MEWLQQVFYGFGIGIGFGIGGIAIQAMVTQLRRLL